jgi:hypothetical protein
MDVHPKPALVKAWAGFFATVPHSSKRVIQVCRIAGRGQAISTFNYPTHFCESL